MEKIFEDLDVHYTIGIDEAAFYGPKLDIQYKNVYGKEDTLVTIQIDMLLAERFGMYYIDENGNKAAARISSTAPLWAATSGRWLTSSRSTPARCPLWMMPEQVRLLPITDRAARRLRPAGPAAAGRGLPGGGRTSRNEKIGYKIREATLQKIPYMLVVGDRDMEAGTVSVRTRTGEDLGAMTVAGFTAMLHEVVDQKLKK